MRGVIYFGLLSASVFFSSSSVALPRECDALMQKVEKRLQGKGIKQYTLEWVPISHPSKARVVGRCNKENVKLIYSQGSNDKKSTIIEKQQVREETKNIPPEVVKQVTKTDEPLKIKMTEMALPESSKVIPSPSPLPPIAATSVQTLIQSLHSNTGAFASSIQELIDRKDATLPLVTAYYAATNEATFRFNVILLLNQKIKMQTLQPTELEAVSQCLVDALKDTSELVRGEALWGLGMTRNKKWASAVNALLNDPDAAVRSEAQITSGLLR